LISILKVDYMKSKQAELDVDFIGGMGPLTKEEEKAISEFIRADKLNRAKAAKSAVNRSARLKAKRISDKV
jgi:hypothetical protein